MNQKRTPGDELRTAAREIRDLAARATHEDRPNWSTGNTLGSRSPVVIDHPEQPSVLIETWAARLEAVNRYIAAMDPNLGHAVADLLEAVSYDPDDAALDDPGSDRHDACDRTVCAPAAALAVARALRSAAAPSQPAA